MKKSILIPTDFSIESLTLVKHAATACKSGPIRIVLACAVSLSDSITERLFYSPEKAIQHLISDDFKEACQVLKNKYSSTIDLICVEVFSGKTKTAFAHFVEANEITEVFIPQTYKLKISKNGFDLIPFIIAAGLTVHKVDWEEKKNIPEKNKLAELFAD